MSSNAGPDIVQDGLVFKYDTADGKSYKGEPTTNVVSQPFDLSSGYSKGTGMTTASGTTLNFTGGYNASTITADQESYIAYTGAVEGEASGVQFTTTWYLKAGSISSVYVSWGGAHTGNRTNLTVNLNTGAVTGVTLASGEFYRVRAEENGYYAIEYSSTLTGTNYYPQLTLYSVGFIYFGGIQIEQKSHATPFVNGTRSATQGLIDRTGNSTIDLSDTSFDSNAQIAYDGTDDYSTISDPTLFDFGTNNFSLDAVVKGTDTGDFRCVFYHYYNPGWLYITQKDTGYMRVWIDSKVLNGTTNILDGNYHHTALVRNGDSLSLYVDGELDASTVGWSAKNATNVSKSASIGRYIDSSSAYPWNGEIPVLGIYNRALTAKEVLQNYRATRSRFS